MSDHPKYVVRPKRNGYWVVKEDFEVGLGSTYVGAYQAEHQAREVAETLNKWARFEA